MHPFDEKIVDWDGCHVPCESRDLFDLFGFHGIPKSPNICD